MDANDLKISAAIRRELSSRRVDLSKLKFSVKSGEVLLDGEFSFVGLEKTNDEIAVELKFIESSIKNVFGVSKISFELTNWKKNDTGIWEAVGSAAKSFDGEGLYCPDCDFVIRFCPCCGKPLVAGAKPGMHKGSGNINKPTAKKSIVPPIKPIVRKPRPIAAPIGTPVVSAATQTKAETQNSDVPVKKLINLAKKDENQTVSDGISLTKKADTNETKTETSSVKPSEVKTTVAKPAVAPKPLKPLRPLKPLANLKPLNKLGVASQKSEDISSNDNSTMASASETNNTAAMPAMASSNDSLQKQSSQGNGGQNLDAGYTSDTPLPNFLKEETSNTPQTGLNNNQIHEEQQISDLSLGSLDSNLNVPNTPSQVPDLGLGLGSLDSNLNVPNTSSQVPDLGLGLSSLDSNLNIPNTPSQAPDLGLGLGSLDSNFNAPNTPQTPDLDLGLGFDLGANIPTTPTPSSLGDLGLNVPSSNEAPSIPNLDMNFNVPDLSNNVPDNSMNLDNFGQINTTNNPSNDTLNFLGGMNYNEQNNGNVNQNNSNDPFAGITQQMDDTPLPPMRPAQANNGFGDDTPLPPMRPAQQTPKASPSKKKSDDLFASLFNDSNFGGNGDGLGNLDLDNFEIISTGDSSSTSQNNTATSNNSNENPFNLGNVLDIDSMMGPGQKDNSGTFNLDDFDINNFKL